MPNRWRIKPGRSLRENARLVLPVMVHDFLRSRDTVIGHPRLKLELHRMRLRGKTLRYAMEIFEPAFGTEFSARLTMLKELLDTMGSIHDCDINVPRLREYLREIRFYNKTQKNALGKIPTAALVRLIREQSSQRNELFNQMAQTFDMWEREHFTDALLRSMDIDIPAKE